jgi:pimeloyl-ACP methyl ester carboxylesterase
MDYHSVRVAPSGLDVYYYRSGCGTPLLYLHPITGLQGWEPLLQTLSTAFDVIAPYAPGWGPSADWEALDGALDIALFYSDLLQALGVDKAYVLGISIGAWMAAEFAAIFPPRVHKLLLVNPLGMWLDEAPGADPFAQHPLRPTEALFSDPALRERLLLSGRDKTEAYIQEVHDLKAAAKFLWPIPDTGVHKRLPRISAPTLVVTSEQDNVVPPAYGPQWCRAIQGAQLATLPSAGHLANLEQPEAVARLAVTFFQANNVRAASLVQSMVK